jgi:hypothetical protein
MCTFVNFKFIKLNASQFKIIIKNKIVITCLQICKITKNYKLLSACKFVHAKFACFHVWYQPMTKFASSQVSLFAKK